MTEEQIIIAKVQVIDQEMGEAKVLDAEGHELPGMENISIPNICEYPVGTLLTITFKQNGNSLECIHVEVGDALPEMVDKEIAEDPFYGWTKLGTEWFSPEEIEILETAAALAETEQAFNVMVIGDSGYGKTSRGKAFAAARNMEYVRVDVSLFREPEEIFFWRESVAGENGGSNTVAKPTQLTNALRNGNVLVQLDELNRAEAWVLDPLFPILDYERRTVLRDNEIEVGENVIFMATVNEGFQFTGTFELDTALRNRFGAKMLVNAPPNSVEVEIVKEKCNIEEEVAEKIVRVLHKLRNSNEEGFGSLDISTRSALQVGLLYSKNMSLVKAFTVVVVNDCPNTSRRQLLDIINSELRQ